MIVILKWLIIVSFKKINVLIYKKKSLVLRIYFGWKDNILLEIMQNVHLYYLKVLIYITIFGLTTISGKSNIIVIKRVKQKSWSIFSKFYKKN